MCNGPSSLSLPWISGPFSFPLLSKCPFSRRRRDSTSASSIPKIASCMQARTGKLKSFSPHYNYPSSPGGPAHPTHLTLLRSSDWMESRCVSLFLLTPFFLHFHTRDDLVRLASSAVERNLHLQSDEGAAELKLVFCAYPPPGTKREEKRKSFSALPPFRPDPLLILFLKSALLSLLLRRPRRRRRRRRRRRGEGEARRKKLFLTRKRLSLLPPLPERHHH